MTYNIWKKAAALLLCTVLFVFTGTSANAFGDTASSNAQNEIDFIASYGIMQGYEDGNFYPDNAITRAEMVAVALRMIRLDNPVSGNVYGQSFSDVPKEHWAYSVVETASALGIINGYPDGTFLPEKKVSYQEAIKIFVSLLGYEPAAKAKGGYPQGYMAIAMQEDLIRLQGVSMTYPASRAAIAVMAYNTLQSKMMTESHYSSNGEIVYSVSDNTMLDIYFNSKSDKGLVTATHVEGLYGKKTDEGKIEIDNVIYRCDIDYADLLGCRVQFFYIEDGSDKEIVSIVEDTTRHDKLVVNSDMIKAFTGIYTTNGVFTYYQNKTPRKLKSVKLSPGMSLIYNNEYIPYDNLGAIDLDINTGTVELIDNDRDGMFDCVKILSYTDYFVNTVTQNEETKYITDGSGAGLVYEIKDVYEKITLNGARIDFENIPKECIVSAAVSADGKAVVIVVSEYEVEGEITSISTDDGTEYIWINDAEYVVSKGAPDRYVDTDLGTAGIFKLNFLGEVSYSSSEEDDGERYGYLTHVERYGRNVEVRMLTENNQFVILTVADKVKFYDQGVETSITDSEFYEKFYREPVYNDVREAQTQVVKYKLNSDGELSLMRTASHTPSTEEFSYGYINPVSGEAEGKRYYANRLFLQSYQITDDTVCFEIPWTYEGQDYTRFRSGKAPAFFSDGNYYQVLLFDVNEEKQIGAVMYTRSEIIKEFSFTLSSNSPVMIVESMRHVTDNETGETNAVISGLVDGEYTSEIIDPEFIGSMNSNMFKFGSAIQYATNKEKVRAAYYEGEKPAIAAATLLCADMVSPETVKWNGGNVEMLSAHRKTTYGTVQKIVGFTVTVNLPDYPYGSEADYFFSDSTEVIIADSNTEKLTHGNFYDIRPGDRIFIRQRYNRIRDVVIYR